MNCQVREEAAVAKIKDRCAEKAGEEKYITYGWQARRTRRQIDAAPFKGELIKHNSLTNRIPDKSILAQLIVSGEILALSPLL